MVVAVGCLLPTQLIIPIGMVIIFPMVIIIFIIVVRVIIIFNTWYVGENRFELILLLFSMLMAIYFVTSGVSFVIGWESIGLISFLLIGYWGRSHALSASVAAVMYNRFGDLVLMLMLLNICNPLWFFVAIMAKSATWLGSYWLPIAIEGPTPVSSLLHSSTIVVAGLYFASLWSIPVMFTIMNMLGICVVSLNSSLIDIKKIIAYSTAVNLALMMQFISLQLWGIVVLHIMVHAFIKASVFIWSGSLIHSIGTQNVDSLMSLYILFGFILLIGLPSIFVGLSKEVYMSEAFLLTTCLLWLVSNYVKNLVHAVLNIEILCVFLLPFVLVLTGTGNIVVIDNPFVILWLLALSHYVVMMLQR